MAKVVASLPAVIPLTAVAAAHAALILVPSSSSAMGTHTTVASIVTTAKVLAASMFSPWSSPLIAILEKTARDAKRRFDIMAAPKQPHVKESSPAEAIATPAQTGRSDAYTGKAITDPAKMADRTAANTGSMALTTCTKLTAPRPIDMTVTRWPRPCSTETFLRAVRLASDGLGTGRMPATHCGMSQTQATRSWATAVVP
mmetsp:Transcript_2595/g.6341  ORF Transcript_2595/g.6341 Transcript_2595/m.6341 type:complete len:200 (+) Transcript_2595:283-882(+)